MPAKMLRKETIIMTLKELSSQYYEQEALLTKQIDNLREKSKKYKGADRHTANRHLCCLYEMRREVHNTAEILENYYQDKASKRIYHKNVEKF